MNESNKKYVDSLIRVYEKFSDVVMAEFLAWTHIPKGLSFEDTFEIYIECMKRVNGDKFFVEKEGEMIEL